MNNNPIVIEPPITIAPVIGAGQEQAPKLPNMWATLVHNDATTPFELVCMVLSRVFNIDEGAAFSTMLHAHEHGVAVCEVTTKDISETHCVLANNLARGHGFELTFTTREETPI